ncbi:WD40-repeat-containing domain protein [Xylogone sp. PMI_703]|nr:WD40-repeat-containing domain protein [Xylogone sp. PMI_703]
MTPRGNGSNLEPQLPSNSSEHLGSSPPSHGRIGRKERRNPSITPRKFTKFFTPRTTRVSSTRHALYDITPPANNRSGIQSSPLRPFKSINGQENSPTGFTRELKRRKLLHTTDSSPERDSVEKKFQDIEFLTNCGNEIRDENLPDIPSSPCVMMESIMEREEEGQSLYKSKVKKRIVPIDSRGFAGQFAHLSIGAPTKSRRQRFTYPVNDWRDNTASFYTKPTDVHLCMGIGGQERCIPFCAAGCNTNSLVAIGDEEGRVRLLDSAKGGKSQFKDVFLAFRVHSNAIIDMSFSQDDSLLATASGDQTARVVDMVTQTTISILGNHSASLKQVRFQPGDNNNSVLATSSRDGSVQIWDLRCKGSDGPVQQIVDAVQSSPGSPVRKVRYANAINSIYDAHRPSNGTRKSVLAGVQDAPSRGEAAGRIGDVSVTAIAFLQPGLEHMLLTASEMNASVKLWDIRCIYNSRRKSATPISCTKQPQSHSQWRHFGITSLNLSSDGSRLYTLCKDNTVYTYSTSHLVLGQAPELSSNIQNRRRPQQDMVEGLGPMYGLRHPQLHATSFYVKSAIRKAKNGQSEVLAVGSSDGCAILFPTDETYHTKQFRENASESSSSFSSQEPTLPGRPRLRRTSSMGLFSRLNDDVPISQCGTALIRGHDREVGSLTWTSDGELVTVGDDFLVRCWREGSDARDLRVGGEQEGRRWGCGWADVDEMYDDNDE